MSAEGLQLPAGSALNGGRYVLERVIGQGGFGITYLAEDNSLQRPVAVKEFFMAGSSRSGGTVHPPPNLQDEFVERRDRIREEARVLARFRHPSIVTVHEFFEENDTIYVVMEFLEGRSLRDLIVAGGALPEAEVLRYARDLADALDAVHAQQLLHRDIKPDNVMVLDDNHVALVDFGTAREFALGQSSLMSQTLTPGYAPVEQYTAQGRFGPATDIYAFGATLYHALTGQAPTPSLDRFTGQEMPTPIELNPALSEAASEATMWAMSLESEERPQSAGQFLAALEGGGRPSPDATRIVADPLADPGSRPPADPAATRAGPAEAGGAAIGEETPKAVEAPRPKPPSRMRRRARRGLRRLGRLVFNLAITVAIGIGATFAIMWWMDRNSEPDPTVATGVTSGTQVTTATGDVTPTGDVAPTTGPATTLTDGGQTTVPAEAGTLLGTGVDWRVVGVAEDDVLNVRFGPGIGFDPPIADFAPDETGIRLTGSVAKIGQTVWVEVILAEGTGWAALTFLESDDVAQGAVVAVVDEPALEPFDQSGTSWETVGLAGLLVGPGPGYGLVLELSTGTLVEAAGNVARIGDGIWTEVMAPGGEGGWVNTTFLAAPG